MDDMFGVVGMVAREWALLSAFLPTIGLMMAVGSTVWLGLCLSIDVPRFVRRKIKEKRDLLSSVMTRVADDIESAIVDNITPSSGIEGVLRTEIDQLRENKLLPLLPEIVNGKPKPNIDFAGQVLHRMAPIVATYGIREARRRIKIINRGWETHPDPEALRLKSRWPT